MRTLRIDANITSLIGHAAVAFTQKTMCKVIWRKIRSKQEKEDEKNEKQEKEDEKNETKEKEDEKNESSEMKEIETRWACIELPC